MSKNKLTTSKDMNDFIFHRFNQQNYDMSIVMTERNKMMKVISELDSVLMKLKNVQE